MSENRTKPVGTVRGRCLDRLPDERRRRFHDRRHLRHYGGCRSPDLPEERERVTITNISVQLPPSPIEQDARQGIRRAHAEANRRIGYVIDLFRGRS